MGLVFDIHSLRRLAFGIHSLRPPVFDKQYLVFDIPLGSVPPELRIFSNKSSASHTSAFDMPARKNTSAFDKSLLAASTTASMV